MDLSVSGDEIVFRTPYSDAFDLIQVMRGVGEGMADTNHPVDFRLAGLQRKGHGDIWHADRVLAFSTDECTPLVINGEDIGGNHGHPCGVRVCAPRHGKTCRDVGSLWRDEAGVSWTLLRVESPDRLLLLSENIGPSKEAYDFADRVTGIMRCTESGQEQTIRPEAQDGGVQLTPAIRHTRREKTCLQGGVWREVTGTHTGVREARLTEEYEVINPATVAEAIRQNRPPAGYEVQPSLARGEAMVRCRMTYRVLSDGTILCDFDHLLLRPVRFTWYLGIMYQEKCDLYGGGIWRYIPKLLPLADGKRRYDFSLPLSTVQGKLPRSLLLSPDTWADPLSPPDRQLDLIAREDGTYAAAFAGGFLPVLDGAPEKRRACITDAGEIVASGKTYPTFAGGKENTRRAQAASVPGGPRGQCFESLRGTGYRKYFRPEPGKNAVLYDVALDEATYVYMDFFSPDVQRLSYPLLKGRGAALLERGGDLTYRLTDSAIEAEGKKGYAVFKLEV